MHAVRCDRGVGAGCLREHDVARVVHQARDRVRRGARGQREQGGERERRREPRGVIPPGGPGTSRPPVVAASAIQMSALPRHQAQYAWILNAWSPAR